MLRNRTLSQLSDNNTLLYLAGLLSPPSSSPSCLYVWHCAVYIQNMHLTTFFFVPLKFALLYHYMPSVQHDNPISPYKETEGLALHCSIKALCSSNRVRWDTGGHECLHGGVFNLHSGQCHLPLCNPPALPSLQLELSTHDLTEKLMCVPFSLLLPSPFILPASLPPFVSFFLFNIHLFLLYKQNICTAENLKNEKMTMTKLSIFPPNVDNWLHFGLLKCMCTYVYIYIYICTYMAISTNIS